MQITIPRDQGQNNNGGYTYSLKEERPRQFARALLPGHHVPVEYKGKVLSRTEIPESGTILLDIPADLIAKIRSGEALVIPHGHVMSNRPAPGQKNEHIFAIVIDDRE